jgi:hypothetical protein
MHEPLRPACSEASQPKYTPSEGVEEEVIEASDGRVCSLYVFEAKTATLMQVPVAAAAVAAALAPPQPRSTVARMQISGPARQFKARPSARSSAPVMSELSLAATVIRDVSVVPTMYALMSLNEYMTHRYFQHLEFNRPESLPWLKDFISAFGVERSSLKVPGDGHVEHHAETYDDMSLKNDAKWRSNKMSQSLDDDEFRGTAFHWSATGIMTIQMLPSVLPTYMLMGWSLPETIAILLPSMLAHAVVWNAVHTPMHGLPPVPLTVGFGTGKTEVGTAFSEWLMQTDYAHWIYENHMGHHVLSGQCNYNVCCPMTDHLLGTYVPTKEWAPKMRPLPANAETRGQVCTPPRGVPQLPTLEEYAVYKMLQKQMSKKNAAEGGGASPEVLVGGGAMIADAYGD